MALEQSLAIIKPDAVENNYIGNIIAMIEKNGLQIAAAKLLQLSATQAEELYTEHKAKSFFKPLLEFMTEGPVMVMVLEGENTIQVFRKLMGATLPKDAAEGTIRNLYADHASNEKILKNAIHGSDSVESATREIDFFFDEHEICSRS